MKYIKYCLILLLCQNISSLAQTTDSIHITGFFANTTRFEQVQVMQFGIGLSTMAAAPILNGKFLVTVPKSVKPGVYRLQYSQLNMQEYIDIIIDGKEPLIDFTLDATVENKFPVFNASKQNVLWYEWKLKQNKALQKIQVLASFINTYSDKSDPVLKQVITAYTSQVKSYKINYKSFISEHPGTWAAKMEAASPIYFPEPSMDPMLQANNTREQFWNYINTHDSTLINTPLYTSRIIEYIQYYMNPRMNFSSEQKTQGFKVCVDTILTKFSQDPACYDFALKYLSQGFKEIANEELVQYIDQNYKAKEQCEGNLKDTALARRLECYNRLKPGMQAPDIELLDTDGNNFGIDKLPSDTLVIVFWASWCPNCEKQMPELQTFLQNTKNKRSIGVLAVSLDNDTSAFYNAISQYNSMGHICQFKGWESPTVIDYCIVASPTFILLDKQRKIIGKYPSVEQLLETLNRRL